MKTPGDKQMSRLGLTLMLCFFLGFPLAGILYFWNDVHRKIEDNSLEQGRSLAERSLAGSLDEVKKLSSRSMSARLEKSFFTQDRPKLGEFIKLGEHHPVKSWAAARDDQMWQFVTYQGEAEFSTGPKKLEWVVTRLYINPEWQLDAMALAGEGTSK